MTCVIVWLLNHTINRIDFDNKNINSKLTTYQYRTGNTVVTEDIRTVVVYKKIHINILKFLLCKCKTFVIFLFLRLI